MHAVSRGAAYYGHGAARARRAHPRRRAAHLLRGDRKRHALGAGLPRPAEGADGGAVRHGRRHGRTRIPGREFGLVVGEPAEFRFFTSAVRKNDQPGDLIEDVGEELEETVADGGELRGGRERVGSGAGVVRDRGDRDRACCNCGAWRATGGAGSSSSTCGSGYDT